MIAVKMALALVGGQRREGHGHALAEELGLHFHMGHAEQIVLHAIHQPHAQFLVGHFTAAELQLHAHLVALVEKLLRMAHLRHVIVLVDVHPELDFLELARALLFLLVLRRLILEFAEVHDSAHGWIGGGRHLDKVETHFLRSADRIGQLEDAELFTGGREDHTHLAGADPTIDTILDLNREALFLRRTGSGCPRSIFNSGFADFFAALRKNPQPKLRHRHACEGVWRRGRRQSAAHPDASCIRSRAPEQGESCARRSRGV